MDANGTRYHLLLGTADWMRCDNAPALAAAAWARLDDAASPAQWDVDRQELRLRARPLTFASAPRDDAPDIGLRRGAAGDAFGNWYAIDSSRKRVQVWSDGSAPEDFWPPADAAAEDSSEAFGDTEPATAGRTPLLAGLAVTTAHYLVVGTLEPAGLLVFDLYGGGAPQQLLWPGNVEFVPYDLAAGPGGVTWLLDRQNHRCWMLDRSFAIATPGRSMPAVAPVPGTFGDTEAGGLPGGPVRPPLDAGAALTLQALDAVAIDVLPDGTLLVLDRDADPAAPCAGLWLYQQGQARRWAHAADDLKPNLLRLRGSEAGADPAWPALRAHDCVLVPDADPTLAALYIADTTGNQAWAFRLEAPAGDGPCTLALRPEYLPLRRFGGKGLAAGAGGARYDFADAWVPLVEQQRPRFEAAACVRTPVFDSREPACTWHRVFIDAGLPAETQLRIYSRASDEAGQLERQPWLPQPLPYCRRDGSELPFAPSPWGTPRADAALQGQGTWELLLQATQGRHLQLALELSGNQRATPRLRALRAYAPRFSYLARYLPAVYREDSRSADFVERLLANFEGLFTGIEDRIAAVGLLLDWRTAPPDALPWLAGWLGAALDPAWDTERRRLFIRHARLLFRYRGTTHGLKLALALALEDAPDATLFDEPERVRSRGFGVRVVENYYARRLPDVLLGDPSQLEAAEGRIEGGPWQPADGRELLNQRYARHMAGGTTPVPALQLPLLPPAEGAERWALFTETVLGFTPGAAQPERLAWQAFLEAEYDDIDELNAVWRSTHDAFDQVPQFTDWPEGQAQRDAWSRHMRQARPARTPLERLQWQAFLRQRHGAVSALNAAHGSRWPAYDLVPLPELLPPDGPALLDWFQFEAGVLAIKAAAHRFRVLLPMPVGSAYSVDEPARRLALAQRVVEVAKPAHTCFELRMYWAMFRVGEARLGLDTRVDTNMREQLIPPLVLGRHFVGEALVGPRFADRARQRWLPGAQRLRA